VKSALAHPQANKKGKKQSTSNCLRMLAMQDRCSAFMDQDDAPAYSPMCLCSSSQTEIRAAGNAQPGRAATDLEGKPGGSGWRTSTKAPAALSKPSSFCCLPCLASTPVLGKMAP